MKDLSTLSQIALQVQKDFSTDAKRISKACEIVKADGIKATSNPNTFAVKSQSTNATYLVRVDTVECGCKDAQKSHVCKHFLSTAIYRALPELIVKQSLDEFLSQWETKKAMQ